MAREEDRNNLLNNMNDDICKRNIIGDHHAILITLTNTFCALFFKSMAAFIAYIMIDYGFTYKFTVSALSIGNLSCLITFIFNPLLLHLPTNIAFFLIGLLQCLSCFLLWYFPHNKVLFIIGVMIISIMENTAYGSSNTVISTFVNDSNLSHKYLSGVNGAWTIATFLYFGVGYIMDIGSIWLYLEIMFIIFMILAILNLILMPNISTNKYNLTVSNAELPKESQINVSIKNDLSVLSKIKSFWFIMIVLAVMFLTWGYFYPSFGPWLKQLFNIDQVQFGYIAGLAEGFGNLCGILTVTYLAKTEGNEAQINSNGIYKLSLQAMIFWSVLITMIVMTCIFILNCVEWYNEIVICIVIGVYFFGQEAAVCSALILQVNVVPPLQQARASAIAGITQAMFLFLAQITVTWIYDIDGMQWESFILLLLFVVATLIVIYLNKFMKQQKLDEELIWINKNRNNINKYT